ncbi:MAG: DNA N-6-adenine-methyltransferase [Defluviicoccus sp.]|nr:DNA N-6-adenine-methyltransferase [Defluviicoccus sp.]
MTNISLPAAATPIVNGAACSLPALIDRARNRLAEARTSAEILEVRAAAKAALHYAKLQKAANETQADCLLLIKRAEMRLVEEVRAAREQGEVARNGGDRKSGISVRTPGTDRAASEGGISPRNPGTDPATLDELGLSRQRFAEWSDVYDAGGEAVVDEAIQAALDEGRAPTNADVQRAVKGGHFRSHFTGENEWYTPAPYVEAARACLGSIDLDPASAPAAQETIRAARFFTRDDDGLKHDWHGRIWLNPPYAQPDITRFIVKLLAEIAAGRATEAILLTHNYTDTGWFHAAAGQCAALCFTRGRIRFVGASGEIAAPTQGQAFFYFGPGLERFRASFASFGFIR